MAFFPKPLTKSELVSSIQDKIIKSKVIATSTLFYETEDYKAIRYWQTDVVKLYTYGVIELNSGGYRTNTTKKRINDYLYAWGCNFGIYQEKSVWYLSNRSGERSIFYDGVKIKDGAVIDPLKEDNQIVIKKKIEVFIKELKKLNELPHPNSGDCWICHFETNDSEKLLSKSDTEHLESHLDEKYIHGTLIYNAFKAAGYQPTAYAIYTEQFGKSESFKKTVVQVVRKYFKSRFGIAQ